MKGWRLHRSVYDPLDTTGSHTYGGRWNPRGHGVVYASIHFAGGMLELLARTSTPRRPPEDHVASLIEVPDDAGIDELRPPYPTGWDDLDDHRLAQDLARTWLEKGSQLSLVVPSVPGAPVEQNLVINASHPRFADVAVVETVGPIYDRRIWG